MAKYPIPKFEINIDKLQLLLLICKGSTANEKMKDIGKYNRKNTQVEKMFKEKNLPVML